MTSLRRRVQGNAPGGSYCPRRRRASRLDESIVQEVLGAKPAMHHLIVTEPTALISTSRGVTAILLPPVTVPTRLRAIGHIRLSVCLFQQHF